MTKQLTALAALALLLLTQRPHAQASQARIFFVDVGTGAGTLIVSPTGKTLLVDGGPPGGGTKIQTLLSTLGLSTIDYTVVTHYHIDHISGVMELLNADRVAGTAFDNGDDAAVAPPGTLTSPTSTRGTYLNYVTATGRAGVTRQTIQPGQVIDLGGGMRATCIVVGGRMLSGGTAAITNDDLNTGSISLLIEYGNFDYLVSGDLTGGGSTSAAKTPDIETYVGQMVRDVDVVQVNHHGSTTTTNQTFLSAVRGEVAVAQTGEDNRFGHPHRETVNKYLNTAVSNGNTFSGTGVPAPGVGPVFYQNEASPAGDDRVTQQGINAAAAGNAGNGTILLQTDGTTTYSLASFEDSGARIAAAVNTYAVDGASNGLTTDFPPTVFAETSPVLPLPLENVSVAAAVNDRESPISSVILNYAMNGTAQSPITMTLAGAVYQATIPAQPDGARVDYTITATAGGQATASSSGYFSGTTTISSLRALNAKGEPLHAGYAARVRGMVTASGFSGPDTNDDYVQDATGAINVYRTTDTPTPFVPTTPGQTVEARGRIGFNGGRLRLDIMESIEKTTSPYGVVIVSGGPAPTPVTTTLAAINSNPESFEGQFVSIANVSIASGTIPATPQSIDRFVTVADGTGTFSLKIDDDTDLEGFTPAATFTAVGIIQQDDFLRPFDAGHNITPRSRVDLGAAAPAPAPLLTIADARIDQVNNTTSTPGADFIPDRVGQTVTVRGAVTSIDFRGGTGIEYYVQDATGGIDLFSTSVDPSFAIGDNVEAIGVVTHFNGLTELTVVGSVTPLGGTTAIAPEVVTLAQLGNGGAGEAIEGRLVRVDNVTVTGGTFGTTGTSNNVTIADSSGSATLRVDSDTNIDGNPAPTGVFSVIALASQFDTAAPFDGGYQILPRSLADIIPSGPGCAPITIGGSLPGGVVGTSYSQTLTASGGTAPYTFSVSAGSLPAGLTLSSGGVVSGTPTQAGSSSFTVLATAAGGCTGSASFTVNVFGVLTVTPPSLAFGTVTPGNIGVATVTITNTSGGPLTLNTPFTISGADASHFQVGAPETTALGAAASTTATVTFLPTTSGPTNATLTVEASGGASATVALTGTGGGVVISEFRTRGPLGGSDEFVEIYNNSDAPVDVSGWKLMGSSNTAATGVRATVPSGTILPGRAHFLFVNVAVNGYSGTVPGNASYTTGVSDNGGIALTMPDTTTIVDQVGVATTVNGYRENTALTTQLTTNTNRSYERRLGGFDGSQIDTNNNGNDFQLIAPSAPQNLASAITPAISVPPAPVNFGNTAVGVTGSVTLTITSYATTDVTLTPPFVITGTDASEFSVAAPGTTTLASGSETTATVTFQPASLGSKSASLFISSTNGGTRTVALSGLAVCPAITVSGTLPTGEFGDVYAHALSASGGAGPYTFRVDGGTLPSGLTLDASGTLSGRPTALGTSTFTVEARAVNGCTGTADFAVMIADTTPPVLTLPGDLIATAASPSGAVVSYAASASDLVDGPRPVVCAPVSGSRFAIGTTGVSCTATDGHGNQASAGFRVTVTPPVQPGRMIGDGRIEIGSVRHEFDFFVQERPSGADASAIRYRVKTQRRGRDQEDRFDAIAMTGVSFFNVSGVTPGRQPATGVDTVMFAGTGRWNGRSGYMFEARAIDAGEPGRGHDAFAITVRDAGGHIVASVDATIVSGNIQSLRIRR